MMSDLVFKIGTLFVATEAQSKIGIKATFNMTLENSDGILLAANDMKLMQSREGTYYIESAFRSYDGKDKEGNPKKMKINYVKFFPEKKNWDKQEAIIRLVLDELEKKKQSGNTYGNQAKPSQPASPKPPAPPTTQSSPKKAAW